MDKPQAKSILVKVMVGLHHSPLFGSVPDTSLQNGQFSYLQQVHDVFVFSALFVSNVQLLKKLVDQE